MMILRSSIQIKSINCINSFPICHFFRNNILCSVLVYNIPRLNSCINLNKTKFSYTRNRFNIIRLCIMQQAPWLCQSHTESYLIDVFSHRSSPVNSIQREPKLLPVISFYASSALGYATKKKDASNKARLLSAYNTKAIGKDLPYRPRVVTSYTIIFKNKCLE